MFIGPYMTVAAVWTIADIFNGLMALPNMIALIALSGVVVKETKDYFARLAAAGNEDEMAPHLPGDNWDIPPIDPLDDRRGAANSASGANYPTPRVKRATAENGSSANPRRGAVLACATGSAPILLAAPRPPKRTKKTGDPCAQASPHR